MSIDVDFTIVGGGLLGLLTALRLQSLKPDSSIVIVEQELYLGEHTSSRNSGVLHSGLYYQTGSLKHQLCLEGLEMWPVILTELGVSWKKTGKFVYAKDQSESAQLTVLRQKATLNQVEIRELTVTQKTSLGSLVEFHEAFFVPSTCVMDAAGAIKTLQRQFEKRGGIILRKHKLSEIEPLSSAYHLEFVSQEGFVTQFLVNCAGLEATKVRNLLGKSDLTPYYVKGYYLKSPLSWSSGELVYPVPPAGLKGLGVHLTVDLTGVVRFGPNTEDVNEINYALVSREEEAMKDYVASSYHGINRNRLEPDYAGIRPKILLKGVLHKDFWVKGGRELDLPNYAEACGIESPGLTAAPAIARLLVERLLS